MNDNQVMNDNSSEYSRPELIKLFNTIAENLPEGNEVNPYVKSVLIESATEMALEEASAE